MSAPLLEIDNVSIGVNGSHTTIVDRLSLQVGEGERFGIVGESGSGKSMTLRSIIGLLPRGVSVRSGAIRLRGKDLVSLSPSDRRSLLGPEIAMIFQEPMTALNPVIRVVDQIAEGPRRHLGLTKSAAHDLAIEMMAKTGIPDPARRARSYPHQLSGGLRQRIMIAMALSCRPKLLLCDEPTTALDVTVQFQVLRLLEDLCDEAGASLIFVTHDLAVVNQVCSTVAVMYAGRLAEVGTVREVFRRPHHPYSIGLLNSAPDFDQPNRQLTSIPGFPPNLAHRTPGCAFAPRCQWVTEHCGESLPPLEALASSDDTRDRHTVACFETNRVIGVAS